MSRAQLSGVPVVSSADNRQIPLLSCKAAPSEREGGQERGGQRYRSEVDQVEEKRTLTSCAEIRRLARRFMLAADGYTMRQLAYKEGCSQSDPVLELYRRKLPNTGKRRTAFDRGGAERSSLVCLWFKC